MTRDRPLRIVSYNVRYFGHALRGLGGTLASQRGIAGALAALDPAPDIICLQEVETASFRSNWANRSRSPQTQLAAFMDELERAVAERGNPFHWEGLYFRAHDYKFGDLSFYTTGLAILVDERRVRIDRHNVSAPEKITHHHLRRVKDTKQTRICAHLAARDEDGHPLHIFNTHLSLPTPFAKAFWTGKERMGFGENQLQEAKTLATFVQKHAGTEPFIVCGDFNATPGSPVYRYLTEDVHLRAAQAELGQVGGTRGFPTAGFMHLRMHLDHLFCGGHVHWMGLEDTRPFGDILSPFHRLSDHVPLLASFRVESI